MAGVAALTMLRLVAGWTVALLALMCVGLTLASAGVGRALPRGDTLVFTNYYGVRDLHIYLLDMRTRTRVSLAGNTGGNCCPAWSPDGRSVAFAIYRNGETVIDAQDIFTGSLQELARVQARTSALLWSPDGRWLLSMGDSEGQTAFHLIDALCSEECPSLRVTPKRSNNIQPAWSPDSRRLAFVSARDGNFEIYTLDISSCLNQPMTDLFTPCQPRERRVTHNTTDDLYPSWSPDGRALVYASDNDHDRNFELYRADPYTGALQQLTRNAADDTMPAWSPDGREIAFISNRDGENEVYTLNVADGSQRRMTRNSTRDYSPAWSPDGRSIIFQAIRPPMRELHVVDATCGCNEYNLPGTRSMLMPGVTAFGWQP
jgi:Tol biopolymer transport system component